ncbi:MAG: HAMP domain-containing sensor histidine kinase [Candidatus Melainabacteria bacterium]|nr:HAMP domain-containing sensor histidine kinase [Candidatus Melainabacteria bacterium]
MGSTVPKDDASKSLANSETSAQRDARKSLKFLPVASRATKLARRSKTKAQPSNSFITIVSVLESEEIEHAISPYDLLLDEQAFDETTDTTDNLTGFEHYSFYKNPPVYSNRVTAAVAPFIHAARELELEEQDEEGEENQPYVVGDWVVNTIPCLIRGLDENAPVLSIIYPRGTKRRFFTYRNNQLAKVETVLGEDDKAKTRVVYTKDLTSSTWHMSLDGITSRLPGEITLSDTGVFHVQVDDTGRCRREYPDGTISVDMACSEHHKGAHALIQALMSEEDGSGGKNNRTVLDLLSVVSHDLRSPLTSVQGLLTLLSAGAFGVIPDKARERIASVESDLTRLTRLINELLDAEMLVSGKLVMRRTLIDVQDLFDAAVGSLSGLALQQKVHLSVIKSNLQLYADKDRLVRVLVNIVANAIKYSPKGANVVLSAEFNGDSVILKVKDSGRGIPTKYQKAIFERFQQVSEGDWSEKGGVGLGLAISKSIVEAHGGIIGVDSQPSSGSTFWVRLPANTLAEYV